MIKGEQKWDKRQSSEVYPQRESCKGIVGMSRFNHQWSLHPTEPPKEAGTGWREICTDPKIKPTKAERNPNRRRLDLTGILRLTLGVQPLWTSWLGFPFAKASFYTPQNLSKTDWIKLERQLSGWIGLCYDWIYLVMESHFNIHLSELSGLTSTEIIQYKRWNVNAYRLTLGLVLVSHGPSSPVNSIK